MTIVEFMTARLDEAEAWHDSPDNFPGMRRALLNGGTDVVLADIAAKRVILARYEAWDMGADDGSTVTAILLGVVQTLASVYADHADYRQEWKP